MANNTPALKVYAVRGFTEEVTTCQICGREELKGTVVLRVLDGEGNEIEETYAGTGCAAHVGRWTQHQVKAELRAIRDAAQEAARQAERDEEKHDAAAFVAWVNGTYGASAETRSEAFDAACAATGLTPFKIRKAYTAAMHETTSKEEKTVKTWTDMTRGDFYTAGTQLDMFAGIEGDGCGTISLDELAAEEAAPVELPERTDGTLFGLTLSEVPADGALFSVVAA